MNKITAFLVIVITTLSFILGATLQSKAQSKAQGTNFAGVVPFMTSNNRMGFFDQGTGKVYMYDDNISQCLFVGQLTQLGLPIQSTGKS